MGPLRVDSVESPDSAPTLSQSHSEDGSENQVVVFAVLAVGSLVAALGLFLACKACRKEPTPQRQRLLESNVRLTDAADEAQDSDWLSSFLTKSRLKQHISAFREARCEELADIIAMGRETMWRISRVAGLCCLRLQLL